MTEEIESASADAALEWLSDTTGQSYILADSAWNYLAAFEEHVTTPFVEEYSTLWDSDESEDPPASIRADALSRALSDKQRTAAEARGIVTVWPHRHLVTASDVSAILVEAVGREPSDAGMLGSGSTADVRHRANVTRFRDHLADEGELPDGQTA